MRGPRLEVAVFGGVGDAVAHVIQAALVDQVDDQLHFVDAFEVGHLRRIAGFDEGFKSGFDECRQPAAEDGLFAEEIGFAFIFEGGFDDAAARAADAARPGQADFAGLAGGVLEDRQQARHAAAFFEFAAHQMARALGGDQEHIDILRRHDRLEMEVESVRRAERFAGFEVRRDRLVVNLRLHFIGQGDDDQIRLLDGVFDAASDRSHARSRACRWRSPCGWRR